MRFEEKSVPTGVWICIVYTTLLKAGGLISWSAKLTEGGKTTPPVHYRFLMSK